MASLQPRGLLARGGSPGPASTGRAGVTFLISAGISIVGEELSGAIRRSKGRRDGCALLVSYRHASTRPPQPSHFTASVRPAFVGICRLTPLCSRLCLRRNWPARNRPRELQRAGPAASPLVRRCRRGAARTRRAPSGAGGPRARRSSFSLKTRTAQSVAIKRDHGLVPLQFIKTHCRRRGR